MSKRNSYDYEIVIDNYDFEQFPLTLPDGSKVWGIATVTLEFDANIDSWNHPDAANSRHEEINIGNHQVNIELTDIEAFDSDGNEVPATEELRQHLIDSFPTHRFHEKMCAEFESANDPWNSSDDDDRE